MWAPGVLMYPKIQMNLVRWPPLGHLWGAFFGTFWCYFLVFFWVAFLEAILSEIVAQRLSKRGPGVIFGTNFVHFFRFLEKVKIELSLRREPHF